MTPALEHVFQSVAASSWRSAVLVVLLFIIRWSLTKYLSRQVLALFWLGIALVALAPFAVVPAAWSPFNYTQVARLEEPLTKSSESVAVPPALIATTPRVELVRLVVLEEKVGLERRHFTWVGVLWLVGVGCMLLWQGGAVWNLRRSLRGLKPTDDRRLLDALESARRELAVADTLPIYATDLVATPALCGIWRPCLLFPSRFADGLDKEELRFVMLHELGHWRRRDLWLLTVLQLARAVHWFNPALWLALRFARQDCELACDEFVLGRSGGRDGMAYGETLLKVLGRARRSAPLPSGISIVENKRQLLKRFAMIMTYRPVGFFRAACGVLLLGGFAAVGLTEEKAPASASKSPAPLQSMPGFARTPEQIAEGQKRLAEVLKWEANVKLELRAVGEVGGVPVALIDVEGEPMMAATDSGGIMGLRIGEINVAAKTATIVNRAGEKRVLSLTDPRPIEFPKIEAKWFLTPEAIAQRQTNRRDESLPSPVAEAWPRLNREAKEEILLSYLKRGTVLGVRTKPPDGISTQTGFLFSQQQRQVMLEHLRERREKFLASLTPEQRAEYGDGASMVIRFTDPPDQIEKQRVKAQEIEERRKKVIASLTPAQKALYAEMTGQTPGRPSAP